MCSFRAKVQFGFRKEFVIFDNLLLFTIVENLDFIFPIAFNKT